MEAIAPDRMRERMPLRCPLSVEAPPQSDTTAAHALFNERVKRGLMYGNIPL